MLRVVDNDKTPALDLHVTSLSYGGVAVLGEIALQVRRGETLALVGPSGIGKTSLLRIVAGLETSFQGRLNASARVAMVFQEPTLLPWRNLIDNIRVTVGVSADQASAALAEVGLQDRGQDFPGQLSLGQQRRLSLARAFALKPELLLMDEPFVSLDPELADEMMALFVQLRQSHDVTTILVTHVEEEAKKLASRIVTLAGQPAKVVSDRQNSGAYFQLSASGVTSSRS